LYAVLLAGGQHGRNAENAGRLRQSQSHLLGLGDIDVSDELHRADLMVDQQQGGILCGESGGHSILL
jgi:hypothetical protein